MLFAKGGRDRTVGIEPGGMALLSVSLAVRGERPRGAPLLRTAQGRSVTSRDVVRLLPALGRKAGIAKRVHAHGLRHTHAAQLRTEGVHIGIIWKQPGRRSISTTATCLDHACPLAVVEAVEEGVATHRANSWEPQPALLRRSARMPDALMTIANQDGVGMVTTKPS